jgi:4-hydroxyphenylpyruvate dioxygenase
LRRLGLLIDGEPVVDGGQTKVLLPDFLEDGHRPDLLEFIECKGDEGFM